MSTALAIGAVSAVLRNVLDNGLTDAVPAVGSRVTVTVRAPDLIKLDHGADQPLLNLFAYRMSLNPGWCNAGQPTRDSGGRRIAAPPLGVDVHYLLTAYGRDDLHAEILLGYGMHLLHDRPFLDRAAIRNALELAPVDTAKLPAVLREPPANAGLADQLETLKITWDPLNLDEMSKLWSALQSHYRPSVAYQVSVVLIEATPAPGPDPLPVLKRTVQAVAELVPPYPGIDTITASDGTHTAQLGEQITVHGHHLAGTKITVHLTHRMVTGTLDISVADNADQSQLSFLLPPEDPATVAPWPAGPWPAGLWTVSITLTPHGETAARTTNLAVLQLAAKPTAKPTLTRQANPDRVRVVVNVSPRVQPGQQVAVALDSTQVPAAARAAATGQVVAKFIGFPRKDPPQNTAWLRVRIDGVDSRIIDYQPQQSKPPKPPVFLNDWRVTIP